MIRRFDNCNITQKRSVTPALVALACVVALVPRSLYSDEFAQTGTTAQSHRGMVVSVTRPASEIGRDLLNKGGNAVDAAVGVAFALQVTWPEAGNIGGGGFMLIHPGQGEPPVVIDYREKAPAAASPEMFSHGKGLPHRLVGVPGTIRGLKRAHEKYGRLSWQSLVLPSVKLASEGIEVNAELARSLNGVIETSRDNDEFLRVYGKDRGQTPWKAGDWLVQAELAATLSTIATDGADAFYSGRLADLLQAEMQRGGGLITREDLAAYVVKERIPVQGTFRGYDVLASPPPSSGGVALIQMLNTVENFNLRQEGRWSVRTIHLMIESMRRAYCDRARHLGDPDFTKIPEQLTTKNYAGGLAHSISLTNATSSASLGADILSADESPNTTHFSIIDRDGMAVSNTYTLEDSFGSRIVVRGAGYLLNDEMGDFNPKPGVTNSKGLIGTAPNLVAPGKRMLSSMTPVIVTKDGRPVMVTGSPGGRTIINTVFCVLINVLEYDMPLREAVDAPRFHHAWMPDMVTLEPGLMVNRDYELQQLRTMGHAINPRPTRQGDAHSIFISSETHLRTGVADTRRDGWAAGQ